MLRRITLAPALLTLLTVSCQSEDPRLPQSLYDEAVRINQQGKTLEAKSMMEMIAQHYPDTPPGKQARKDLYILEAILKQDMQERQKQLRVVMRRVADALTRYRGRHGEYPSTLMELVPEYLDKAPETSWGHPFLYRPYVTNPIVDVKDRRGNLSQRINTSYDGYQLACLGVDLQPGGDESAADTFIVDGEFYHELTLPMIPQPQPVK